MSIEQVEKAEIFPLNPPADGVYGFRKGFPIIQFQIANQDKFLNPQTLRLNGSLQLKTATGTAVANDPKAGASATNGICLNHRLGVPAVLQQITLATQTNQTLEVIRNYGRCLVSVMPATHSQEDYDGVLTQQNPIVSSRSGVAARSQNTKVDFSIPLRTGLLGSGQPIPLGTNGLRGMMISLELSPDSNAISGYSTFTAAGVGTNVTYTPLGAGASYEISDLSLSYDLLVPDDSKKGAPATGQFVYNSISHLYGVVNSADETQSYNLGTTNTLAVIHNFLPSSFINNYSADGFSTDVLKNSNGGAFNTDANIKKVSFIRGGQLFPLDYSVDVEDESAAGVPQTQLEIKHIDSIKPFSAWNHASPSMMTQEKLPVHIQKDLAGTPVRPEMEAEPTKIFGAGINLDPLTRSGVNFKNTNYAVRIESELDGLSPNSIFTYVVAKNVLTYSPQGISVSS